MIQYTADIVIIYFPVRPVFDSIVHTFIKLWMGEDGGSLDEGVAMVVELDFGRDGRGRREQSQAHLGWTDLLHDLQ